MSKNYSMRFFTFLWNQGLLTIKKTKGKVCYINKHYASIVPFFVYLVLELSQTTG